MLRSAKQNLCLLLPLLGTNRARALKGGNTSKKSHPFSSVDKSPCNLKNAPSGHDPCGDHRNGLPDGLFCVHLVRTQKSSARCASETSHNTPPFQTQSKAGCTRRRSKRAGGCGGRMHRPASGRSFSSVKKINRHIEHACVVGQGHLTMLTSRTAPFSHLR